MKTRPAFNQLPVALQEHLLWQMDLDYDAYDSSKVACIHEITNGTISEINSRIVKSAYAMVSDADLDLQLRTTRSMLQSQVDYITKLLA
jgi:hypothetical protein